MIKRILVGLAGTTFTPVAIRRAVLLAQAHAAELTGVTVLDARRVVQAVGSAVLPWSDSFAERGRRMTITRARIAQSIADFEAACRAANVPYQVVEETGDAFTRLVDLSRYHDLMIFGLRSIYEYDYQVPDPEELLLRLIGAGVRPMLAESDKFQSIGRVMVAYNGSMESAKAMRQFVQMRLWPDAELKIVTFHPSDDEAYELMHAAEEYCAAHGHRVCHQSNPGDPKLLLLAAATLWQADLLVMGNSARSVLTRKLLGETVKSTLRYTQIPLFLGQ